MGKIVLIVHGGAGQVPESERGVVLEGLRAALRRGFAVLRDGGSAVTAVVEAVSILEDLPQFNAGRGSVLTEEGSVEMDASVMEGSGLRAGAVAGVTTTRHPIFLADAVLRHGREVFLVGKSADQWGRRLGLEQWDSLDLMAAARVRSNPLGSRNTVGAVACDLRGHLAAATSTGGRSGKRQGRVGDSAVIGAGTYADDERGAASATGDGEAILRLALAHWAVEQLERGIAPERVAAQAIDRLARGTGAQGGLILVDRLGRWGAALNTPQMPVGWIDSDMPEEEVRLRPACPAWPAGFSDAGTDG